MRRTARLLVGFFLTLAALGGCGAVSEESLPQATGDLDKGTSLVPREGGGDAIVEAYELAGSAGRKLFHAEGVAWTALTGASNEAAHSSAIQIVDQARKRGFQYVQALLPIVGASRDQIALPPGYPGPKSFSNPEVRSAFLSEVAWFARNLAPDYLSLGTEIQGYFRAHPDDYDDFASLAGEAYDLVKSIRPATKVLVYFQYESIYRDFPGGPAAAAANLAALVAPFEPRLDLVGLSSYPGVLGGAVGASSKLPGDYYSRLAPVLRHPLFFAELGHPSGTSLVFLPGSEAEQAAFVTRFFELTSALPVDGSIWAFLHDPDLSELPPGSVGLLQEPFFESSGLRRRDGSEKPSWSAWVAAR